MLTGKTIPLDLAQGRHATILDLKQAVHDKEGIPSALQRIVFGGKELIDDCTLGDANIENDAVLHNAIKSRLAFSPNAPRWRCADPGLNIEGMCTNRTCDAHSHLVIAPQRWTPFNPTLQSAHCPLCNSPVMPKTCGLYQCKWRFDGVKHDAQVTSSGWQVADGDVYHRFSSDESNLVTWQSLVLVATPLDEPSVCGLCFEGTWGVRGALTRSACNCQFHALCLTAGVQRPHVQPACPACHARL
ncbi:Aste57867_15309 [Aphanomyces stellatus]|uniref:Aste57867_15309 protein n=1 Tax=Aphanomyces stellatus TaxID=120398 RepID=A0A485L3T8_9STRA|nr:hypothetical protein As57867_015253 [Aphanomyces stellatus]VFT92118.1 Aste57867_15309 [Aphanomyces stellatus]